MDRTAFLVPALYVWLRQHMPVWIRRTLRAIGLTSLLQRWYPQNSLRYAWPLHGALEGHRMHFGRPEELQYQECQYEVDVCAVVDRLVLPGWVCVDVGAHIGYMTLLMAKLVGAKGRIYAFEAAPENALLLEDNVRLNGYQERVIVENKAVAGESQEQITLYVGPSSFEATVISRGWQAMDRVPAVALDCYFAPDARVDLVKMDIEGGEVQAIAGMRRLMTQTRPLVLLEIHDMGWPAVEALLAANYTLCDLTFHLVDVQASRGQLRHCVAIPNEKRSSIHLSPR